MSNLYVASEYKNKIINLLLDDENFVKLMAPVISSDEEDLGVTEKEILTGYEIEVDGDIIQKSGQIYDYNFVTDTTTDRKTFLFVETSIENIQDNIFTDFILSVCVFSIKNLVKLGKYSNPTAKEVHDMGFFATNTHANRIDALCDCVDGILNENSEIKGIGDVEPTYRNHMMVYNPNPYFYGKCLNYHIKNYNPGGDRCGD